jgi:hypothetical protein
MLYSVNESIGRIPVVVTGDFVYGGKLHNYMAGTIFAGSSNVAGLCVFTDTSSRISLPCTCRDGVSYVELYYVDALMYGSLFRELNLKYGLAENNVVIKHGGKSINGIAFSLHQEPCKPYQREYVRMLIGLPPQTPPPSHHIAVYIAEVEGLMPCSDNRAFCVSAASQRIEVAIADIVLHVGTLETWLQRLDARLSAYVVSMKPLGLAALANIPLRID